MQKHRTRLIAIALMAALSVVLLVQVLASADNSVGGGFGYEADDQHGFYVLHPELAPGDHFSVSWEWVLEGFRPVFAGGDFYVVEGPAAIPFDPANHNIVFHGHDGDPGTCCNADSVLEMGRASGQDPLTFVWVLNYDEGWQPVGAPATGLTPLMGGMDTTAQERELRYIHAFIGAAGEGDSHGPFQNLQVAHGRTLDREPWFLAVESVLVVGATVFWAIGLGRPRPLAAEGGVAGLITLVERGREHLRAQFRLHLILGPLLFMVAIFGTEAMDNGSFGFYDPTGVYEMWVIVGLLGLWLMAMTIWVVGLVRVSRSLRHFNRTQEPDLGA